jgi:phage repressor protein C with HTH and peptisase S24 domain
MSARDISARINQLRIARGFKSERALGLAAGVGVDFLRTMREGRNKEPSGEKLAKVAAALGIEVSEILSAPRATSEGRRLAYRAIDSTDEPKKNTPNAAELFMPVSIQEIDVSIDQRGDVADDKNVVATWELPAILIRGQTSTPPDALKVLPVVGDSMVPDFLPGERVLVDTSHRIPSPPGVYVIFDGFGLVLKRLELVPQSDPPMVRLIPVAKHYETHILPLATLQIRARVLGKWAWT